MFQSSSSNSEEEGKSIVTPSSPSFAPPAKRAYREGIGVGGLRLGRRGQPQSSPSSLPLTRSRRQPPPSQRILLQHQQSRKRAGTLERQHRKRVRRQTCAHTPVLLLLFCSRRLIWFFSFFAPADQIREEQALPFSKSSLCVMLVQSAYTASAFYVFYFFFP